MIPAAQHVGDDVGAKRSPHLVVKRGHRGRFRFALITDEGRLTGEVVVETGDDRDTARARAIAKIVSLAHSLSAALDADEVAPMPTIASRDSAPGGCRGEV